MRKTKSWIRLEEDKNALRHDMSEKGKMRPEPEKEKKGKKSMSTSIAAQTAKTMRRIQNRTKVNTEVDTQPADELASVRAQHSTAVGLTAREHWTAWEFHDGSRLLMNDQTGRFRVPVNQRDVDIAHSAITREKRARQERGSGC